MTLYKMRSAIFSGLLAVSPAIGYAGDWDQISPQIPVKQTAFCNLMEQYERLSDLAAKSKNQIKQNLIATARSDDLIALMSDGVFSDWIARVDSVGILDLQGGDAVFDLSLQCGITIGSGELTANGQQVYAATAKKDSVIYRQLAQLSKGEFVLISGRLLKVSQVVNNSSEGRFVTRVLGDRLLKGQRYNDSLKFFADVSYLAKVGE